MEIGKVCEYGGATRWRLVHCPAKGKSETVQSWDDRPPHTDDVEWAARDHEKSGKFRLYCYAGAKAGPSAAWTIEDDNDQEPNMAGERAAVRELVRMAREFRMMADRNIKSWERLARDQLSTVAKLQTDVQELREEVAMSDSAMEGTVNAIIQLATEQPELVNAGVTGIITMAGKAFNGARQLTAQAGKSAESAQPHKS